LLKRKLVLKKLSPSDLTIFEHQFRNTSGTKQKGINLDKAVFLGQLYPNLKERLATKKAVVPLQLNIYGPGGAGLHSQLRKVLLQAKNIRLNGEYIANPIGNDNRYDDLEKDDLAIIEFVGDDEPHVAKIFLVAKKNPLDTALHKALMNRCGEGFAVRKAMQLLTGANLLEIIEPLTLPEDHPILDFIDGDALEDAAQNGIDGIKKLRRRRQARGVSPEELERAKRNAERNGRLGEELLNAWFDDQMEAGAISGFSWVADENAVATYDFIVLDNDGGIVRSIDAKSTSGDFGNRIHVSAAELDEMVHGGRPYDLYRLYGIGDSVASFRVAEDVGSFLESVLSAFEALPEGIRADSVSIDPLILPFGEENNIDLREHDDSEDEEK